MNQFIFDTNKCVGCHACAVACSIENKVNPPMVWRKINAYNKMMHPDLPLFYYSLACNHCDEAPCMKNCPSSAYSRDEKTGAVIHDAKKCIGCKYCTWACPYDAPKYNAKTHIIEKCNFCNHRILNNLQPACANLCPTGALSFGSKKNISNYKNNIGFIDTGIKPSIQIIPLRKKTTPIFTKEQITDDIPFDAIYSKIQLKNEWVLACFTLLAAILTALITANTFSPFSVDPFLFLGVGIGAACLSMIHIGKKLRLYRSIFNLKNSWLSREVFFYSGFLFASAVYLFLGSNNAVLGWIAIILGYATLVSIDMVYHVAKKATKLDFHSAHVFLTGLFFTGLFMKNFIIFAFIGLIKAGLYIYRKYYFKQNKLSPGLIVSAWRLDLMIPIPLILWWFNPANVFWYVLICIIASEVIDRFEYYYELEIITPKSALHDEMMKQIDDMKQEKLESDKNKNSR